MFLWMEFDWRWVYGRAKHWKKIHLHLPGVHLKWLLPLTVWYYCFGNALCFSQLNLSRRSIWTGEPLSFKLMHCNVALCLISCNTYTVRQSLPRLVRHPSLSLVFHSSCHVLAAERAWSQSIEAKPLCMCGSHTHSQKQAHLHTCTHQMDAFQ